MNDFTNEFDLRPIHDYHKSFYGKAHVWRCDDGTLFLRSYDTFVMALYPDGTLMRGEGQPQSRTTSRHMCEFAMQFAGTRALGKHALLDLPVHKMPRYRHR